MSSKRMSRAGRSAFLVERYVPSSAKEGLTASVAGFARLCADQGPGLGVEYLQSVYLPTEDTCFCLFRGTSDDAVRDANHKAGFALDRITDALLLLPIGGAGRRPNE